MITIYIYLSETEAEKDLGVTVDKKPTYKNHVTQATSKANCILGVMHRTFNHITD